MAQWRGTQQVRCRPAARTRLAVRARMLIILGLLRCEWSAPLGHSAVPRLGHKGVRRCGIGAECTSAG